MKYKRFGDTWFVRIDADEEVMESLKILCERENIRLAQVEAIGASKN